MAVSVDAALRESATALLVALLRVAGAGEQAQQLLQIGPALVQRLATTATADELTLDAVIELPGLALAANASQGPELDQLVAMLAAVAQRALEGTDEGCQEKALRLLQVLMVLAATEAQWEALGRLLVPLLRAWAQGALKYPVHATAQLFLAWHATRPELLVAALQPAERLAGAPPS